MPISAIDLFRPAPQDGVAAILSGATSVLTNAINNSVQIGRDAVNLRATQEKEFLAERERLDNMEQRRAEFLTRTNQLDRQFLQDKSVDARDFKENVMRDKRNFDYRAEQDRIDNTLEEKSTLASILNAEERNTIERSKVEKAKAEETADNTFLKARATDILQDGEEPSFIRKLFGVKKTTRLPEDEVALGRELKAIGDKLKDPDLSRRGDDLISKGTGGILTRREEARPDPAERKKQATPEERVAELRQIIQAYEALQSDPEADDLSNSDRVKLNRAKIELEELLKAGKSGSKPVEPGGDPLLDDINPPKKRDTP